MTTRCAELRTATSIDLCAPWPAPRSSEADPYVPESGDGRLLLALRGQSEILRLITSGAPARHALMRLAELGEESMSQARCAIPILDAGRARIVETVAPRLAPGFQHAINEEEIANEFSPGARAIARRRPVIVASIDTDEVPAFRQLAATYDLKSCWAYPINNRKNKPVGALLLYFRDSRSPAALDDAIAGASVAAASLVLEHERRSSALRSADQRFAALAESIPGVVYQRTVSPSGEIRYTYISEGARELFGVAPDEILTDPNALFDCHGAGYRESFRDRLLQASRDLALWDVEATIVTRDGKRKFTHALARPHRADDGTVVWNGVILDATRIKEAELQSSDAEARTRGAIVESLNQGFMMFDTEDRLVISNTAYIGFYPGLRSLVVPGTSYEAIARAEAAELLNVAALTEPPPAEVAARLDGDRRTVSQRELQLADGRWLMVREHRTADGCTVAIHTDISELREREELLRSNRELQDFAAVASHDLQEPLRKIEAFGDRLVGRFGAQLDSDARAMVERMRSAAGRMRSLINDLLDYSRITTQAKPFAPCVLGDVLAGVLSDLQVRIDETRARIDISELPTIDADVTQMRQLLQNLISNAIKFRRRDTDPLVAITARVLRRGGREAATDRCELTVADNGIGFDMKYAERIFQIFQRLHGRAEYDGTGIGLATCRKIVERHGGSIEARSAPGRGTAMIVSLPLRRAQPGSR